MKNKLILSMLLLSSMAASAMPVIPWFATSIGAGAFAGNFAIMKQRVLGFNEYAQIADKKYVILKAAGRDEHVILTGDVAPEGKKRTSIGHNQYLQLDDGKYALSNGKIKQHKPSHTKDLINGGIASYAAAYGLWGLQTLGRFAYHDNLAGCKNNKLFTTLLIGSAIGAGSIWAGTKGYNWLKNKSKSFAMPSLPSIPEWVSKSNGMMLGGAILAALPVIADLYIHTR